MPRNNDNPRHRETYNGVKIDLTAPTDRILRKKVSARKKEIDELGNRREVEKKYTVSEWADVWVKTFYINGVGKYTYSIMQGYIKNHIKPGLGHYYVHELLPIDIQEFLNTYKNKSASLVSHIRSAINLMMDAAVVNRLIQVNPVASIKAPKCKSGSHRALTDDEKRIFLLACDMNQDGLIFKTMMYLGLSPQEIKALDAGNINVEAHTIEITEAIESKTTKKGKTKTEYRMRIIPIVDKIYNDIVAALPDNKDGPMFRTSKRIKKNGELSIIGGHTLTEKALASRWRKLKNNMQDIMCKEAKSRRESTMPVLADDLTMYCLRHTFATDMMSAGVPLFDAMKLMGHKDTRMLEKIYGHHRADQLNRPKSLLDAYHESGNSKQVGTSAGTKAVKIKKNS